MPPFSRFLLACYLTDAEKYGWDVSLKGLTAYVAQREHRKLWKRRGLA